MAHEKNENNNEGHVSSADFVKSYNSTIPASFPHLSEVLSQKFKHENPLLFKHGDLWSLDEHRKKVMDWFQLLKTDRKV